MEIPVSFSNYSKTLKSIQKHLGHMGFDTRVGESLEDSIKAWNAFVGGGSINNIQLGTFPLEIMKKWRALGWGYDV